MTTEQQAADVIRKHRYMARNTRGRTGCRGCRWVAKGFGEQARLEHEAHVAAALAAAGLLRARDDEEGGRP